MLSYTICPYTAGFGVLSNRHYQRQFESFCRIWVLSKRITFGAHSIPRSCWKRRSWIWATRHVDGSWRLPSPLPAPSRVRRSIYHTALLHSSVIACSTWNWPTFSMDTRKNMMGLLQVPLITGIFTVFWQSYSCGRQSCSLVTQGYAEESSVQILCSLLESSYGAFPILTSVVSLTPWNV